MTKDELWEKYVGNGVMITRDEFLAALSEYGQHIGAAVRKRDAEICRSIFYDPAWHSELKRGAQNCAAAIEATPLP